MINAAVTNETWYVHGHVSYNAPMTRRSHALNTSARLRHFSSAFTWKQTKLMLHAGNEQHSQGMPAGMPEEQTQTACFAALAQASNAHAQIVSSMARCTWRYFMCDM
jgi:hypothetical protein